MFEFLHGAFHPFDLDGLVFLFREAWPMIRVWLRRYIG